VTLAGQIVSEVLREAVDMFDAPDLADARLATLVKEHFQNRWYRFFECGVTSRFDLAKMKVSIVWYNVPKSKDKGRTTNVDFTGTPLAGQL
jgi:hypothetical protein